MVVFDVGFSKTVEAPDIVRALAICSSVHRVSHLQCGGAFHAFHGVDEGVVRFVVKATAESASL